MIQELQSVNRSLLEKDIDYDVVVVGGGLAGVTASVAAARKGVKVALVQDRPVLGGNASSEIRLWALGATSHMGNNNRWAREGGIVDEFLTENLYRNREGNPVVFDTVLLDLVMNEKNIDLYLNTAVFNVKSNGSRKIERITAFNSQNSTLYNFSAKVFIDSSGDGIMAYQAGVPFRIGAENANEFNELMAPDKEDYGELLGHTLFFYSKQVNEAVDYVAPDFALKDVTRIPRINNVKVGEDGCNLWWFEYGGRRDTVHETEEIKHELWSVAYGVWNHIKNSGNYTGAENYTLEWVGLIPGKRESRRFEGHYMLSQSDIIEQRTFKDAISFGGWAIDLHPADGVYSSKPGCSQWHSKGVYQIPLSCYIPKELDNLLLAGRIISVTHVAFGSTRVMSTCAHGGQAVGTSSALAVLEDKLPKEYLDGQDLLRLQNELLSKGHYIPGHALAQENNKAADAVISASSEYELKLLEPNGEWEDLNFSMAQMIPVSDKIPAFRIKVRSEEATTLNTSIRISDLPRNQTPDVILEENSIPIEKGEQEIVLETKKVLDEAQYVFYTLNATEGVEVAVSDTRITGVLSVYNKQNPAVSNFGRQEAKENMGVESFEFWTPKRRPDGPNMAFKLSFALKPFSAGNLLNGILRPASAPNAWMASLEDKLAKVSLEWPKEVSISEISLYFDPDYDHPMESVQFGHPERVTPFCVCSFTIYDAKGDLVYEKNDNHLAVNTIQLTDEVKTTKLTISLDKPSDDVPVALFGIQMK